MQTSQALRILLVEDSENDALLLEHHLLDQGLAVAIERVEDLDSVRRALSGGAWDVLLSDFHLPATDGFEVLREAQRFAPEVPCLIVSGWIDEASAVDAMRAGAKDFIAKNRLSRLAPAILREVDEARSRTRARAVQEELDESEGRLSAIVGNALDGIVLVDGNGRLSFWNPAAERIFGFPEGEALGRDLRLMLAPSRHREAFLETLDRLCATGVGPGQGQMMELAGRRKDGSGFPLEITLAPLRSGPAWRAVGILRDITERKRMEEDLKQSQRELRQLALHLQDIAEGDRKALAREIHDELGQAMTALKMDLNALALTLDDQDKLNRILTMTRLVNGTIKVIQRVQSDLRPTMLDDLGLGETLHWQLDEFAGRSRIDCSIDLAANLEDLEEGVALAVFRIFQEALTNVARHAQATRVEVAAREEDGGLELEIRDNGRGIAMAEIQSNKSFGLMSMRERALALGGTVEVGAAPGGGTRLLLRIPWASRGGPR